MSESGTDDRVSMAKSAYSDVVLPTVDHSCFAQDSKAQRALLALLYEKLAIEHRTSNHQLFLDLDPDRQGVLEAGQFRKALADVGVPLTAQQLHWLVQSFDLNRDQGLDYSEFVQMLAGSRAGRVGAVGAGKTGLEWAPEPQGSPFQVADEAREEVRRDVCCYGIHRSIRSLSHNPLALTPKTNSASVSSSRTTPRCCTAPQPRP